MFISRLLPVISIFLFCTTQTHGMLSNRFTQAAHITRLTPLLQAQHNILRTNTRSFSGKSREPYLSFGQTVLVAIPLSMIFEGYQEAQRKKNPRFGKWNKRPTIIDNYPPASDR